MALVTLKCRASISMCCPMVSEYGQTISPLIRTFQCRPPVTAALLAAHLFPTYLGDCCTATCKDKPWAFCSRNDYECFDPEHNSSILPWPDCDFGTDGLWTSWNLNNSVCNMALNNPACRFDGGRCKLQWPEVWEQKMKRRVVRAH